MSSLSTVLVVPDILSVLLLAVQPGGGLVDILTGVVLEVVQLVDVNVSGTNVESRRIDYLVVKTFHGSLTELILSFQVCVNLGEMSGLVEFSPPSIGRKTQLFFLIHTNLDT